MSDDNQETPWTVLVAMTANLTIAVAKFIVAAITGSAAMFAEGVHSVVDTLNQILLLIGVKRSHRVPDDVHPLGYGKEVYFWTVIYSVLMLGIGGGVTIFNGVAGLLEPEPIDSFISSYVMLAVAAAAEGTSWVVAVRAMIRGKGKVGLLQSLREDSDPSRFVIVGEDSAALVGLVIAGSGIGLSQSLNTPIPDAIASILIGLVLCLTAGALISKTKELIVGRAATPEVVAQVKELIEQETGVVYAGPPLTMQLGPDQTMVAIDIRFRAHLIVSEVAQIVDTLEAKIRERFPHFTRIYIEPQVENEDVDREQPAQQALNSDEL